MEASRRLLKELCDEATCSICLEYFKDPVMLDCGHNFCQACLARCWGETARGFSCPQCRETAQQRSIRSNWQLANMIEILRKLEEDSRREGALGVCERHREPLKLFCRDDAAAICVVCDRSKEHREHSVIPIEEVPQRSEVGSICTRRNCDVMFGLLAVLVSLLQKQKVNSVFERMYNFLEELELLRLAQLGSLKKEIEEKQQESIAKFSEEISHLNNLITEVEGTFQQPERELPQVRVRLPANILNTRKNLYILLSVRNEPNFSVVLLLIFLLIPSKLLFLVSAVNFTLDPNTANPFLILSDDLKSVRRGSKYQVLPDNPERFDIMMSVLGREIFTSGRHWWEVEVEENLGRWAVGVARESVRRKGVVRISPDEGFWAVGKSFRDSSSPCQILAFTSPKPLPLTLRRKLRKIRVFLDYEEDRVEFFDVDSDDLIFTFHSASFSGEKILPFFRVWRGVRLKSKQLQP
uniref:Zinc finger protein RFP-like n=1 Tax=Varanus komodoensis TaxID=61221 RepID=A0A8D2IV28_VARKO